MKWFPHYKEVALAEIESRRPETGDAVAIFCSFMAWILNSRASTGTTHKYALGFMNLGELDTMLAQRSNIEEELARRDFKLLRLQRLSHDTEFHHEFPRERSKWWKETFLQLLELIRGIFILITVTFVSDLEYSTTTRRNDFHYPNYFRTSQRPPSRMEYVFRREQTELIILYLVEY